MDTVKNELRKITKHQPKNPAEITIQDAQIQLLQTGKFDRIFGVVGAGKEATVLSAQFRKTHEIVCVKVYRYYSSTNLKRMQGSKHISWDEMAMLAAKKEYWNLKHLFDCDIPVPQPLQLIDNMVVMEFIDNGTNPNQPAPLLRDSPNQWFDDPEEVFYETVDILVRMFLDAHFTHGDYNDHNLMYIKGKLITMDVTQAMEYNANTFVDTPVRIRLDKAAAIFLQDLRNLNQNFLQKFRISGDINTIYATTIDQLPEKLQGFLGSRDNVMSYSQFAPEIYALKERYRQESVQKRSKRRYQSKRR